MPITINFIFLIFIIISNHFLQVSPWLQLFGIVEGQDGVAERGSEVAAALAPFHYQLGNQPERLHHVFRLPHVYKAHGSGNDACRTGLALAHQLAQLHQRRRGIAKGKERIGMLLYSQTDAGLRARDALRCSHRCHALVVQVAARLDAQSLQGSLAYAAHHHRYVGDDRLQRSADYLVVYVLHGLFVGMQYLLHVEVGSGVDGMQQCPEVAQRDSPAASVRPDGAERLHHDFLPQPARQRVGCSR